MYHSLQLRTGTVLAALATGTVVLAAVGGVATAVAVIIPTGLVKAYDTVHMAIPHESC
jgi:hypothetical protein